MESIISQWLGDERIDVSRIDIKNQGGDRNNINITVANDVKCQIDAPKWFGRGGKGYVLNTFSKHLVLNITCVGDGELIIRLRGLNIGKQTNRLPALIDYTKLVVNGDAVFSDVKTLWHDRFYTFTKAVKDKEFISVEVYWEPHRYVEEELLNFGALEFMEILTPAVWMQREKVDFRKCIDFIDGGEESIYMVDHEGKYTWWSIDGNSVKVSFNSDGSLQMKLTYTAPIVLEDDVDINSESVCLQCRKIFSQNAKGYELPITSVNGYLLGKVRRNAFSKETTKLDWGALAGKGKIWLKGKIYVSSEKGPKLQGLVDVLKNIVDVDILSLENIKNVFKNNDGLLIYGKDIYPDVPKMSADEFYNKMKIYARFEDNINALSSYEGFHGNLSGIRISTEMLDEVRKSCMKEFLAQVESDLPVLLEDAYDIEELTWMCDKLRVSEKFGSDNHLYLKYKSYDKFIKSMNTIDWTYIISTGKVVFLLSDEDEDKYYPKNVKKCKSKPLEMWEINEIVDSIPRGASGSDFFNMILDSHPSLLTIGWHGLPNYSTLWKVFCEGKSVSDAIKHMKNPNNKKEQNLLRLNLDNALKYKSEERLNVFFEKITNYLMEDGVYNLSDWFKAFFLSANEVVGRTFEQRIAPAIFYDHHGGLGQNALNESLGIQSSELIAMKQLVLDSFKYKKYIGIVRNPLGRYGSFQNIYCKYKYRNAPNVDPFLTTRKLTVGNIYGNYLDIDDTRFDSMRQVRFEDLKLYPKETTEKVCEFLCIPWSETCLNLTTNGEDSGIVDGTAGFDVTPVYNPHLEYLSTLDYYRIELLNYKNYSIWGYKPKYYDGMKYSREQLKVLFGLPFKVETQKIENCTDWPSEQKSKDFHEWILAKAIEVMERGEKEPVGSYGGPVRLVECLFPDLQPGQKLFEN